MNNALFNEKAHLTKMSLTKLKNGFLTYNELVLVAEHITNCEGCAGILADSFDANELADAPLGFEEEVKSKIKNKKENNIQFVLYSLKVSIAACIALVFVFSNTLNFEANIKVSRINPPDLSIVNSINTYINNFSQKIIDMEVFNNEKEKK